MMTNVVAKKSSKSFLKNRVVEQNVLGPVGVTSEGSGVWESGRYSIRQVCRIVSDCTRFGTTSVMFGT